MTKDERFKNYIDKYLDQEERKEKQFVAPKSSVMLPFALPPVSIVQRKKSTDLKAGPKFNIDTFYS